MSGRRDDDPVVWGARAECGIYARSVLDECAAMHKLSTQRMRMDAEAVDGAGHWVSKAEGVLVWSTKWLCGVVM